MTPLILPYKGVLPKISPKAFVAPSASIIGDVEIGAGSGIWFNCVVRGDVAHVKIGERTNIQDGTVIHVTRKTGPTTIGSGITIGHKALLHACTVEDDSFVGMGATMLDFSVVERGGFLAAGALLTPKKIVKTGEMWAGNPARFFRPLTTAEADYIPVSAQHYVNLSNEYKAIQA